MQEFEQRRKAGFGTFFDEDAINKRNPFFMADLLRTTPGVTVAPSSSFGSRILMRGTGFQAMCAPTVFVDGVRVFNSDGDLDAIVNVQDVQAMEVYSRGSSVPSGVPEPRRLRLDRDLDRRDGVPPGSRRGGRR